MSSILLTLPATAQEKDAKEEQKKESFWSLFKFNGFGISTDLFGYAYTLIGDYMSGEAALEVNFGNRLYPIAEVGYGWCDATDELSGIKYKTSAPYYRVGLNYNFLTSKEKPNPKHYVYGLIRVGWTNFKYDLSTPPITDPIWGDPVALDLKDVDGSCIWGEIGAGIKVKIAKGFHMGWSIRYKMRFSEKKATNSSMWYIPGYGINAETCFGGTYSLIYDIPIKKVKGER